MRGSIPLYATATALMIHGWLATIADAQRTAHPPQETSALPQWACVLIFTAFIVAIAFKNPKRTHQS